MTHFLNILYSSRGKEVFFPFFILSAHKNASKTSARKIVFGALLLSGAVIVSCASVTGSRSSARNWNNPGTYITVYNEAVSPLRTLSAEGYFTVQTADYNKQGSLSVTIKLPDSLKVKLEGPLGIDIATFFIDAQKYILVLHRQETVYTGTLDTLNFGNLIYNFTGITIPQSGISMSDVRAEIIHFFTGGAPLDEQYIVPVSPQDTEKNAAVFRYTDAPPEVFFEFPYRSGYLKKITVLGDGGIIRAEKSFSRYKKYKDAAIPCRIVYTFYEEKSEIGLQYLTVRINKKIRPETFRVTEYEKMRNR